MSRPPPLIPPSSVADPHVREVLMSLYNAVRVLRGETRDTGNAAVLASTAVPAASTGLSLPDGTASKRYLKWQDGAWRPGTIPQHDPQDETDPTVPSHVKAISQEQIESWDQPEADPTVPAHVKAISADDIDEWDLAHDRPYLWANHQAALSGTFTSGAWQTRPLTTLSANEIEDASLLTLDNSIILPAGRYMFFARAPAFEVDRHQARLYNVTTSAVARWGSTSYASASGAGQSDSIIYGPLPLSAASAIRLEHYCQTTRADKGFGVENSFGGAVIFAEVHVWQLRKDGV